MSSGPGDRPTVPVRRGLINYGEFFHEERAKELTNFDPYGRGHEGCHLAGNEYNNSGAKSSLRRHITEREKRYGFSLIDPTTRKHFISPITCVGKMHPVNVLPAFLRLLVFR